MLATARVLQATRSEGTKLRTVGLSVLAWASGPIVRSLKGNICSKSRPRTSTRLEKCLTDRMPQFHSLEAWGR